MLQTKTFSFFLYVAIATRVLDGIQSFFQSFLANLVENLPRNVLTWLYEQEILFQKNTYHLTCYKRPIETFASLRHSCHSSRDHFLCTLLFNHHFSSIIKMFSNLCRNLYDVSVILIWFTYKHALLISTLKAHRWSKSSDSKWGQKYFHRYLENQDKL